MTERTFMSEYEKKTFSDPATLMGSMRAGDNAPAPVDDGDGLQDGTEATPYASTPATAVRMVSKKLDRPSFTKMPIEATDCFSFAREWRPTMEVTPYIGNKDLLLDYLFKLERHHKVTMPIKVCGIDPIVFQFLEHAGLEGAEGVFYIPNKKVPAEGPGENEEMPPAYELIEVDGDLYLSCVTECLDEEYMNIVLSEATTAIKSTGHYTYQMVDYKKLALEDGEEEGKLIRTLRLNTFEMSMLEAYMASIPEMEISYEVINEHQCICFDVR